MPQKKIRQAQVYHPPIRRPYIISSIRQTIPQWDDRICLVRFSTKLDWWTEDREANSEVVNVFMMTDSLSPFNRFPLTFRAPSLIGAEAFLPPPFLRFGVNSVVSRTENFPQLAFQWIFSPINKGGGRKEVSKEKRKVVLLWIKTFFHPTSAVSQERADRERERERGEGRGERGDDIWDLHPSWLAHLSVVAL